MLKILEGCCYGQHLLDTGAVADTDEIAKREGLRKITVNETLRLVPLAPDIAQGDIARHLASDGVEAVAAPDYAAAELG